MEGKLVVAVRCVLWIVLLSSLGASSTISKGRHLPKSQFTGNCDDAQLVTRAEWGARPPTAVVHQEWADEVFVHHTEVPDQCYTLQECSADMRSMQNYHMDVNGWNDIGYNMVVGTDGRLYEGRGYDVHGAHTGIHNTNSIGIAIIGNFMDVSPPDEALQRVYDAMDCAQREGILLDGFELFGHRDGMCTTCPGDVLYDIIQTWPEYSTRDLERDC